MRWEICECSPNIIHASFDSWNFLNEQLEDKFIDSIDAPCLYMVYTYWQDSWLRSFLFTRIIVTAAIDHSKNPPLPLRDPFTGHPGIQWSSKFKSESTTSVAFQSWTALCSIQLFIIVQNAASSFKILSTFFLLAPFWCCCSASSLRRRFTSISFASLRCWLTVSVWWDTTNGSSFTFPTSLCTTVALALGAFLCWRSTFDARGHPQKVDK